MKIDDIVHETDSYRAELCRQVQNDSGVDCVMLEKDVWVTYVLEKIFADQELSRILRFKGGTSLSKAHHMIQRFSEDVDLVLDWTPFLGIGDPNELRSKTKQAKYNELMNTTAGSYVCGEFRHRLQSILGDVCSNVFDVARNDLTLLAEIVDFTARFYPRSWAHFELCKPGSMLLMPSEHALPVMKADYAAMRTMIYGDYPSFDEILLTIKKLESEINSCL